MNRLLIPFALLGLVTLGCKSPGAEVSEKIARVDRVVFTMVLPNHEEATVEFADTTQLRQLKGVLGWEHAPGMECLLDGSLTYLAGADSMLKVKVSTSESCNRAVFRVGDSVMNAWIPAAVVDLLMAEKKKLVPPSKLDQLAWMLGKWTQTEADGAVSFEEWTRNENGQVLGHSFTLMKADTVFEERMELAEEDEQIYYVVTVKGNEGPVRFRMAESTASSATFENKAHDFPQIIYYETRGDSGLYARISGTRNGQYGKVEFPLKRVK